MACAISWASSQNPKYSRSPARAVCGSPARSIAWRAVSPLPGPCTSGIARSSASSAATSGPYAWGSNGMTIVYHRDVATALVLSAGGMFAAWEVGVWKALRERIHFDIVVGASAGSWNGWAIAGGATPDDLEREWMNPRTADLLRV